MAGLGSGSHEVFRGCKDGSSEGLGERSLKDERLKALFWKTKQDVITQRQSNRNQPGKFHLTNTARLSSLLSAAALPARSPSLSTTLHVHPRLNHLGTTGITTVTTNGTDHFLAQEYSWETARYSFEKHTETIIVCVFGCRISDRPGRDLLREEAIQGFEEVQVLAL